APFSAVIKSPTQRASTGPQLFPFDNIGTSICQTKSGAVGFIDPLSWLIKVELVVEAGQIRAGLLDNASREWRKLCSGNRSAGRLFCPSIMGAGDNLHLVWLDLSVEVAYTFHGYVF